MLPCCPPGLPQLPWFHALHRLQDQSPFAVACTTSRDPTSGVISLSPRSPHHAPGPALPPSSPFSLSYPHVLPLSPGGFGPGPIQAYPSWVFSTQKQLQGFSSKLTLDQATSLCRTSDWLPLPSGQIAPVWPSTLRLAAQKASSCPQPPPHPFAPAIPEPSGLRTCPKHPFHPDCQAYWQRVQNFPF